MSDLWLPDVRKDQGSFRPDVVKPLLQRGVEQLEIMRMERILANPTPLVTVIAERLHRDIRSSSRSDNSNHEDRYLTKAQLDSVSCLIYLCSNTKPTVESEGKEAIRRLIKLMEKPPRFFWLDLMGVELADEAAWRVVFLNGTLTTIANMNNARLILRDQVTRWGWLARLKLREAFEWFGNSEGLRNAAERYMNDLSERILFNFGALHGGREDGLALLYALHRNRHDFLARVASTKPDYVNGGRYGPFLDCPSPERCEQHMQEELKALHDPQSELSRYVEKPSELLEFEQEIRQRTIAASEEVSVQLNLPL